MAVGDRAPVHQKIVLLPLDMRFLLQVRSLNNLQVIKPTNNQDKTTQKDELPGSKAP